MVVLPKQAPDTMGAIPAAKIRPIKGRRSQRLGFKESLLRRKLEVAFGNVEHRRRSLLWKRQCMDEFHKFLFP